MPRRESGPRFRHLQVRAPCLRWLADIKSLNEELATNFRDIAVDETASQALPNDTTFTATTRLC